MSTPKSFSLADRISARRLRGPESEPVVLTRRRIYVLPTRQGNVFALLLFVMLLGSLNYNNNLGFFLTFLLTGLALVSILHTHANLHRVEIRPGKVNPVFAGEVARFELRLFNHSAQAKIAISAENEFSSDIGTLEPHGTLSLYLEVPAPSRGHIALGRVKLQTVYPLGILRAWSWMELTAEGVVYPAPETMAPPVQWQGNATPTTPEPAAADEFYGFRNYHPGDSPKRISWRHLSSRDILLTKIYTGNPAGPDLWLNLSTVANLPLEQALARLCQWILNCEQQQRRYGLWLGSEKIPPTDAGDHKHQCLKALALYTSSRRP